MDRNFMNLKTRKIILYAAGIFILISGILGTFVPQLGLSIFTSVVWAAFGAVFLAIAYGTAVRKLVFYGAGIFLFVAGVVGLVYTQLGISTLNSILWFLLGVLFIYVSYTVDY
jgi:uncharacterized membrane protein YczE